MHHPECSFCDISGFCGWGASPHLTDKVSSPRAPRAVPEKSRISVCTFALRWDRIRRRARDSPACHAPGHSPACPAAAAPGRRRARTLRRDCVAWLAAQRAERFPNSPSCGPRAGLGAAAVNACVPEARETQASLFSAAHTRRGRGRRSIDFLYLLLPSMAGRRGSRPRGSASQRCGQVIARSGEAVGAREFPSFSRHASSAFRPKFTHTTTARAPLDAAASRTPALYPCVPTPFSTSRAGSRAASRTARSHQ